MEVLGELKANDALTLLTPAIHRGRRPLELTKFRSRPTKNVSFFHESYIGNDVPLSDTEIEEDFTEVSSSKKRSHPNEIIGKQIGSTHPKKKSKDDYNSTFEYVQARKNPFKTPDKNVKGKALKRTYPKEIL